jgi:hypothetical protein
VKWLELPDERWNVILKEVMGVLARSKVYGTGNAYLMCRTASSFLHDGIHVVHPADFFARSEARGR